MRRGKKWEKELPGAMQLFCQTVLETVTVSIKVPRCSYNVFYSCLRMLK